MNPTDRAKLIEELERKGDHDVLILAAADVVEIKETIKAVCADVKDHGTRLTVIETNWKAFVAAIVLVLVVGVPAATWIIDKLTGM